MRLPVRMHRRFGGTDVRTMKTRSALILALGVSMVALTGCAAGAGPTTTSTSGSTASQGAAPAEEAPDQTVADACATATASVSSLQTELIEIQTDLSAGRFSVVAEKLATLTTTIQTTAAEIANADVKGALTALGEKVADFAGIFAGATDGDVAGFAGKVPELQTAAQEVATAAQAMGA